MVGLERTCGSAYLQRKERRRVNLEVSAAVEEAADLAEDPGALYECVLVLGVCDEVEVTLSVALLLVLQTVPLLGKGQQGL